MNTRLTILCSCLTVAAVCLPALADEAGLSAAANRDRIYLGESVILTVKVSGTDNPPTPDLSEIKGCTVRLLGSHSDNRYSVVIINGRRQEESFSGRIFTYEITPAAAGKVSLGPVKLLVKGKVSSVPGPSVEVAGLEAQDEVVIEVKSSRETALVGEQFQIRLSVAIRRLNAPYADVDPLAPPDPPALKVPFLEDSPIEGLKTPDIRGLLNERVLPHPNAPGFAINDYTLPNDPFGGMFPFGGIIRDQKARFRLDRSEVTRDGKQYYEYSLKLDYAPNREGSYTFGPVVLTGNIIVGADKTERAVMKRILAVGPACTVRIVPPPEEGRPPSYSGAIGTNLVVETSLDCQTCSVSDPLTLKLTLSGDVNMANIRPPSLSEQPGVLKDFKIYEDTVQTITASDRKEYTFLVRPTRSGTFEFPPIDIAYYDTNDRTYRTVTTEPIPIRVNEASGGGVIIITATPTNEAVGHGERQNDILVPAPITIDTAGAEPLHIGLRRWHIVVSAAGPTLFIVVILCQQLGRNLASRRKTYRLRKAVHLAENRLQRSQRMLPHDPHGSQQEICAALKQFLGDRLDVPAEGLTPADTRTLLNEATRNQKLAERFSGILERNVNAGYALDQKTDNNIIIQDCRDAVETIRRIEAELKNSG